MSGEDLRQEAAAREILVAGTPAGAGGWSDLLSRLSWYFSPYLERISAIVLCATPEDVAQAAALAEMDPLIAERLPALKEKILCLDPAALRARLEVTEPREALFLLADDREQEGLRPEIERFRAAGRFFRVDPKRVRMEGSFYLWAGLNGFGDIEADEKLFHDRFRRMARELGQVERAYVFGTGPSLSAFVAEGEFSDGVTILANSMVLNPDLLDRLSPRIIVAGDPVFHAGCSGYAAAFRRALIAAMERTGAWFLCPLRDVGIYRAYLPEVLQERLIGLPFDGAAEQSMDLSERFALSPYPNILTLLLLPLAASLAREVHIAGCDGRPLAENDGFWKHDRKAQFNDEMNSIRQVHPGFFDIDYNGYYLDHARDLETVLARVEDSGCRVVVRTPSFLPALHRREPAVAAGGAEPFTPVSLAILDPDARGEWGHFLAYDRRLGQAAVEHGLAFSVIGRRELAEWARPDNAQALLRVFTHHSWSLGNKWPQTDPRHLTDFAAEAEEALRTLEVATPEGDILIFMYCGSVEVAEVLEHVLVARPRVRAVINLFWSYNFDITDPKYRAVWQPLLRRWTERPGQVRITHSTPQIAEQFRQVCGVDIPVLPHPSTTFGDRRAGELAARPVRTLEPGRRPRVLFPGGARLEKGYLLAAEACGRLAQQRRYNLCLRARLEGAPPAIHNAVAELRGADVGLDGEDYSEADFVEWLASADVLVIPYLPEAFADRTSGMLVDAMLLGIPVVVIEQTWLADELAESGAGVACAPTPEALVAAIDRVIAEYPAMSAATRQAAERYLNGSQWSILVEAAVGVSGGTLPCRPQAGFFLICRAAPGEAFGDSQALDVASSQGPEEGVILYDDLAQLLASSIELRADWHRALADWVARARAARDLCGRSQGRVRMVQRGALAAASDAALAQAGLHRADLPVSWTAAPAGPDAKVLHIVRSLLQEDAELRQLQEALRAAGVPLDAPAERTVPSETALGTYVSQLDDGREAGHLRIALEQTTAALEAQVEKNSSLDAQKRLLEEQLVQLQAATEQYFAQAEALRTETESARREREALREELERVYHSKSWRVTAPLRKLRGRIGTGGF